MGAGLSSLVAPVLAADDERSSSGTSGLNELPESCVASVLKHLDPVEICSLAGVNRDFNHASCADFVWELKLPSNHHFLARKLFDETSGRVSMRKKDLYARLCSDIRFDGGTKELWLEKRSGKMCMSISWKGLDITGIHDRRYWSHLPSHDSRFQTIAYLHRVWWLEIKGELKFNFPAGSYGIFFKIRVGNTKIKQFGCHQRNEYNHEHDVHGWDIEPVTFHISTSNGQYATSKLFGYNRFDLVLLSCWRFYS